MEEGERNGPLNLFVDEWIGPDCEFKDDERRRVFIWPADKSLGGDSVLEDVELRGRIGFPAEARVARFGMSEDDELSSIIVSPEDTFSASLCCAWSGERDEGGEGGGRGRRLHAPRAAGLPNIEFRRAGHCLRFKEPVAASARRCAAFPGGTSSADSDDRM